MKSNISAFALDEMTLEDISQLDIGDLARVYSEIGDAEKAWKDRKTKIIDALELRFAARATNLLTQDSKIAGTTTFPENGYDVKRSTSLDVKWDQSVLGDIRTRIVTAGESPDVYMTTEFKVGEAAYKAWPANIKAEFDKGRTVKPRRANYDFTPRKP